MPKAYSMDLRKRVIAAYDQGASPQGHWHTRTFVAALRQPGLTAPRVIQGAMDGAFFKADVQDLLCSTLSPADIVIGDNLCSHPVAGVRNAKITYTGPDMRFRQNENALVEI